MSHQFTLPSDSTRTYCATGTTTPTLPGSSRRSERPRAVALWNGLKTSKKKKKNINHCFQKIFKKYSSLFPKKIFIIEKNESLKKN